MEAAMIGSGHGYTPASDTKPMTWNADRQWNYKGFHTALTFTNFAQYWNISAHLWLKYYVFMRLVDRENKKNQMLPTLITYLVSAVWHGIDPGFFVFFFFAGL